MIKKKEILILSEFYLNYLIFGGGTNTFLTPESNEIAFSGQKWAQTPHPMQISGFLSAFPSSFSSIASVGHRSTHVPQPIHKS